MLFINNMIEKALLIKIFAQHIGHSTAVMLLPFFRSHYLFNFHIHRWRRRPMVIMDFVRAGGGGGNLLRERSKVIAQLPKFVRIGGGS